jgi:DNA mismatch repair protein MutS
VARLAGLPAAVVKRARALLAELEGAGLASALPLFAQAAESAEPPHDPLRERLAALDPDALSPREAQALLYELKRLGSEV